MVSGMYRNRERMVRIVAYVVVTLMVVSVLAGVLASR